jgi:endonuclease G
MLNTALHKTILYTLVFFCLAGFSSCKDKKDEGKVSLEITLSRTDITFEQTRLTLTIKTDPPNQAWTAVIEQDGNWSTIDPPSGTKSFAEVVVSENRTDVPRTASVIVIVGKTERSVELSQGARKVQEVPFRIELPLVKDSFWFIQHQYYALEYDTGMRHSVWVAFTFDETTRVNNPNVSRQDNFMFDPKIPSSLQPQDEGGQFRFDSRTGYERGHLVASGDRVFNQAANDETFYISNISPHLPEFHGAAGVWYNLEFRVQDWAKLCDTLYVVKGGAIYNEIVEVLDILNRTVVPKYYYMALVQRRRNEFEGIAFWVEQRKGLAEGQPTRKHVITIRELEQKTGINFFHNLKYVLPGNPNLEEQVETSAPNWSRWTGL